MNKVSVIISTFNRAAFISEAIDSILNQTIPPQQFIVVDDGSTDETETIVRRYGSKVTYIKKENGGKSSALNLVLPMVSSEFVWIFDDDDFAYPDALEQHLTLHERMGNLGFTYGFHDWGETGPDGHIRRTIQPTPPKVFTAAVEYQRINLLRYCAFMHSACVVRRSLYEKVGGFREDLHRSQDYEMIIRLSQASNFQFTGSRTYIIRKHEGMRGPAVNLHSNADRRRVWMGYDFKIGQSILENIPLERYVLANSVNIFNDAGLMREALLRRAWVMASKAHLEQVKHDLLAAGATDAENPQLSSSERECCTSLANHPYFLMSLFDNPGCLQPLLALRHSVAGVAIMRALGKGLYYKGIESDPDLSMLNKARLLWLAAIFILSSTIGSLFKTRSTGKVHG